jgi:hypothetical protein
VEEAVADVGDIVDPERLVRVGGDAAVRILRVELGIVVALAQLLVVAWIGDRLHQALVGVLAEHGRDQRADAHAGEQPRVVPRHHFWQAPHAQLPQRAHFHAIGSLLAPHTTLPYGAQLRYRPRSGAAMAGVRRGRRGRSIGVLRSGGAIPTSAEGRYRCGTRRRRSA